MNDEIEALTKRIAAGLANNGITTEKQLAAFFLREYEAFYRAAFNAGIAAAADECLSQHANGNYRNDYREDCYEAIKELEMK